MIKNNPENEFVRKESVMTVKVHNILLYSYRNVVRLPISIVFLLHRFMIIILFRRLSGPKL